MMSAAPSLPRPPLVRAPSRCHVPLRASCWCAPRPLVRPPSIALVPPFFTCNQSEGHKRPPVLFVPPPFCANAALELGAAKWGDVLPSGCRASPPCSCPLPFARPFVVGPRSPPFPHVPVRHAGVCRNWGREKRAGRTHEREGVSTAPSPLAWRREDERAAKATACEQEGGLPPPFARANRGGGAVWE
jgi:hypothetical protein